MRIRSGSCTLDIDVYGEDLIRLGFEGPFTPFAVAMTGDEANALITGLNNEKRKIENLAKNKNYLAKVQKLEEIHCELIKMYQQTDIAENELDIATDEIQEAIDKMKAQYE